MKEQCTKELFLRGDSMSEDMITKKELLKETDISYGQLYRWKRKNLIPEEWFIKKSAFTGQETYFPREKILNRIAQIKDMKDTLSLDEMAAIFSGALHNQEDSGEESKAVGFLNVELTGRELVSKDVISDIILNVLGDLTRTEYAVTYSKNYTFEEIMYMYIAYKCNTCEILNLLLTIYPLVNDNKAICIVRTVEKQ